MKRSAPSRKGPKYPLIRECDDLVRELAFRRDNRACVWCGSFKSLTPSHLLPKGKYPKLRFELLNILTMCIGCHEYRWHDDPIGALQWLEQNYPGRREQLLVMDATAAKPDLEQLRWALRLEVERGSSHPDAKADS